MDFETGNILDLEINVGEVDHVIDHKQHNRNNSREGGKNDTFLEKNPQKDTINMRGKIVEKGNVGEGETERKIATQEFNSSKTGKSILQEDRIVTRFGKTQI